MQLSDSQKDRYSRQLQIEEIGAEGQLKMLEATVAIIGCGALGSLTAMQLAGAGVGHIVIADFDKVSISNLHRQLFFSTADAGEEKGVILAKRMQELNPEIKVTYINRRITAEDAEEIATKADILIDSSDNASTKYTLEAAASKAGKPYVVGGINGFHGQVMTCVNHSTPFSTICPPPDEKTSQQPFGVVSPAPGVVASILTAEAIKLITGIGRPLADRLLTFNLLKGEFKTLELY